MNKDSMNWEKYEEVTKYIYSELGVKDGIKILCYGSKCKVEGASGVKHQVDVLVKHTSTTYQTAIECKYHKKKISKDPIMKLSKIMEDCDIEYGVIVSKNGFTSDAIKYAEYLNNISLVELRKPKDKDWDNRLRDMTVVITPSNPEIFEVQIYAEIFDEEEKYLTTELTVKYPDGNKISLIELLKEQEDYNPEKHHDVDKVYEINSLPTGTCLTYNDKVCFSGRLVLKYKIRLKTKELSRIEYKGDDLVSFYMHQIFENTHRHIDKYGSIKQI